MLSFLALLAFPSLTPKTNKCVSFVLSIYLSHEQEAGRVKSGKMEGTHKITPLSDNQDTTPSAKSCSVEVGDCSDAGGGGGGGGGEDDCLSLDSGADLEKDVDLPVGNGGSGSGSAGVVKTEEALSESCSQNEPIEAARRNTPLPPVGRSRYHGVTRHRWSGKYEAHLWDNSCRIEGHKRKGRQVYLGSYNNEEKAARAYDLAALKFWGNKAKLNFPVTEYEKELEHVRNMSRDACVSYIRRQSSCFSRGTSAYRGVTKRQKDGRWQARIGLVCGSRDIYLGTFKSEEEAAEAYDVAAVKLRGTSAITNFDISNYIDMPPDGKE